MYQFFIKKFHNWDYPNEILFFSGRVCIFEEQNLAKSSRRLIIELSGLKIKCVKNHQPRERAHTVLGEIVPNRAQEEVEVKKAARSKSAKVRKPLGSGQARGEGVGKGWAKVFTSAWLGRYELGAATVRVALCVGVERKERQKKATTARLDRVGSCEGEALPRVQERAPFSFVEERGKEADAARNNGTLGSLPRLVRPCAPSLSFSRTHFGKE